jgi:hypothetical protein
MNYLILAVCFAGIGTWLFTLINLQKYLQIMRNYSEKWGFHVFIVAVALAFGFALVLEAENSRFPGVFVVLGTIYLTEAILLAVIGRSNFQELIGWGLKIYNTPVGHISGLVGVALVGFIAYAIIC